MNPVQWHLPSSPLPLADGSLWRARLSKGEGISAAKLKGGALKVTFRRGGERCKPLGLKSRPLKKILQTLDIPPWERSQVPLFYHEDSLVGVGHYFICEGWQVEHPQEDSWVIDKIK